MKLITNAALLFILSFSNIALSAVTVRSVGGASYTELDTTNNKYTVYGGIAGECSSYSSNSTCDSCKSNTTNLRACNTRRVNKDLMVVVTFSSDQTLNNAKVEVRTENQGGSAMANGYAGNNVTAASGSNVTVAAPWSYFCQYDSNFNSTACTPSGTDNQVSFQNSSRSLNIWVDENNNGTFEEGEKYNVGTIHLHYIKPTLEASDPLINHNFCISAGGGEIGICGYTLKPGDEKLYLQDIVAGGGSTITTDSGAPDWHGLAMFAVQSTPVASIRTSMADPVIRTYNSSYELQDSTIDGLSNYVDTCVLVGNINKAQNIYHFINSDGGNSANTCASPSEVVGMLSDKSCFISTAAFGSDMASEVQTFREFRNKYMLSSEFGRTLVKTYYKYSPALANIIADSEVLRAATRTALYPVLGFVLVSLQIGLLPSFAILAAMLVASAILVREVRRRRIHV